MTFAKLVSGLAAKTYTDSTVTTGNYCFQVTATFNGVESVASNQANAAVPASAPTGLVIQTAQIFVPSIFQSGFIMTAEGV